MHPAFRFALVVVGLAAVVYGTASLRGGWLGTPPWWERPRTDAEQRRREALAMRFWMIDAEQAHDRHGGPSQFREQSPAMRKAVASLSVRRPVPRECRESISGGVVAAGLALVAFGAWPRRRRFEVSS